ncbi:hypothetical protein ONS96_009655, partial [Cadophora gregata f. sp. sojae]
MGELEEQMLAEVRARVLAARQVAQRAATQRSSASTSNSMWAQDMGTEYVQEIPLAQRMAPTSHPVDDLGTTQAYVAARSTTSSIGISKMSVNEKIPALQGAMHSAYGQSVNSQHNHGQRPTD